MHINHQWTSARCCTQEPGMTTPVLCGGISVEDGTRSRVSRALMGLFSSDHTLVKVSCDAEPFSEALVEHSDSPYQRLSSA